MRLKRLVLKNFRSYKDETTIDFAALTTIIGRNDKGKSSILEALEIFFNNKTVKIDSDDANKSAKDEDVVITCVFDELPQEVVLDKEVSTSLASEGLVNDSGDLVVSKSYDCTKATIKPSVSILCNHPLPKGKKLQPAKSFLLLKNEELKAKLLEAVAETGKPIDDVDKRSNPELRRILETNLGYEKKTVALPLVKSSDASADNGKAIWSRLEAYLPVYALFKSDRSSNDGDSEVQSPLKAAVAKAVADHKAELDAIADKVRAKVTKAAETTVEKMVEMDKSLAALALLPEFDTLKWEGVFKVGLRGGDDVPINKRGSGFRRLVLLNFFRAEAEKSLDSEEKTSIIYAVEEPETSQHPDNQRMLMRAFNDLSQRSNTQVILTTHQPALAGQVPIEGLRFVQPEDDCPGGRVLGNCNEAVLKRIADTLGVVPDHRVRLVVCLEGPTDVTFWYHMSKLVKAKYPEVPCFETDARLAVIILGGSTLLQWVQEHYLRNFKTKECHLYDSDIGGVPGKYQDAITAVNKRGDGSWGSLTAKREIENYLHVDAIDAALGFKTGLSYSDTDDVPALLAEVVHNRQPNPQTTWAAHKNKKLVIGPQKHKLCDAAASKMTLDLLKQVDPKDELIEWLRKVGTALTV